MLIIICSLLLLTWVHETIESKTKDGNINQMDSDRNSSPEVDLVPDDKGNIVQTDWDLSSPDVNLVPLAYNEDVPETDQGEHELLVNKEKPAKDGAAKKEKKKRIYHAPHSVKVDKWSHGVVKYFFKAIPPVLQAHIRSAAGTIEGSSCLRFDELKSQPKPMELDHYLLFSIDEKKRECQHAPQRLATDPNAVEVNFGLDCLSRTELVHTLMHGIGFIDEVNHFRRDEFVSVQWSNIQPKYLILFAKDLTYTRTRGFPFDPQSIMMFHDRAFTNNGGVTIKSVIPGQKIKPSRELSDLDKEKLQTMFGKAGDVGEVYKMSNKCRSVKEESQAF